MTDSITTTEAAHIIGCGQRHVAKLCHSGAITFTWFGRVMQISRASAEAYRDNTAARKPGPRKPRKGTRPTI